MNPNTKPAITVGEDDRVMQLYAPEYCSASGTNYTLVITKLISRRFHTVSKFEVEQFANENSQDEDIIFIEQPISGVAVCREILQASAEEAYMHPVVASATPELEGKTDYERHNYTITYEDVDCGHPDCSLHFDEVEHLPEPMIFILGASLHDPEVLEMNEKRAKRRKLIKMRQMVQVLQMLTMLQAAVDSVADDGDVSSAAEHIAALEAALSGDAAGAAMAELEKKKKKKKQDPPTP
jgi:hypothetical protein